MVQRLPPNPSQEQLEQAYAQGLLRKESLEHGKYYRGHCRNASVARWHGPTEQFVYMRTKLGESYAQGIKHPADEKFYDAFAAKGEAEPEERERISELTWERWGKPQIAEPQDDD